MQRRILIIRQDRIGDAVLATPLPREIKKRWPDCHVAMLLRGVTQQLFENNPHVDEVILDNHTPETRQDTFWPMVRRLRKSRFTHALMLLPEARINYMVFCAGIPVRVGHGLILFHVLTLTRPVMTRKLQKGRHEGAYSMDLACSIGVKDPDLSPVIYLTDEEKARMRSRKTEWGAGRKIVGLHTTSGKSAPNWDADNWRRLADILLADGSVQVGIWDKDVPSVLANLDGVLYPNTEVSLRETMVNTPALDLLVSASTGPMHIAAALKVPTLALFCPLPASEPALWGAVGNHAEYVLPEEEYCRDQCPGDPHICTMQGSTQAGPELVAQRILQNLQG